MTRTRRRAKTGLLILARGLVAASHRVHHYHRDEAKEGDKATTEAKEGDKATTEPIEPSEDAALPDKPPMLALLEPKHEPGTTGGDKGNGPPLFAPLKKQSLSLARAAGEKITVGFKMEEVENMGRGRFYTQRDTLLHNILGRWDPQCRIFRKLRYAMVLLEEVAQCGGAPIKHKNWTIVRACVVCVCVCVCVYVRVEGILRDLASGSFVPALFVCALTWYMLPSR